jgi:hypothetical protein
MNEIKFACPHCNQHIACDENYGGCQISCPACQNEMIVPHAAHADLKIASAAMKSARSAALYARPSKTEFWTEEAWQRHVADLTQPFGWPIKVLLVLPIASAWLLAPWIPRPLISFVPAIWIGFSLVCSTSAAWLIARGMIEGVSLRVLTAIPLALGIALLQLSLESPAGCCLGANT